MLHVCCKDVTRGLRHLLAQHLPWVCALRIACRPHTRRLHMQQVLVQKAHKPNGADR